MLYGHALVFDGQAQEAVEQQTIAWRLARHEAWRFHIAFGLAAAHYMSRQYDGTLAWADRGLRVADYLQLHIVAAGALAQLGRLEQAREELGHLMKIRPNMTATRFRKTILYRHPEDQEHYMEGLVKAGLPE